MEGYKLRNMSRIIYFKLKFCFHARMGIWVRPWPYQLETGMLRHWSTESLQGKPEVGRPFPSQSLPSWVRQTSLTKMYWHWEADGDRHTTFPFHQAILAPQAGFTCTLDWDPWQRPLQVARKGMRHTNFMDTKQCDTTDRKSEVTQTRTRKTDKWADVTFHLQRTYALNAHWPHHFSTEAALSASPGFKPGSVSYCLVNLNKLPNFS